ncbi:unnamed protein product [Macrosiphum euphorbiae]|uniref:Uncharacterized protein n=1 Tax=Macrosiphum euphorbiae TaxID=13131 RepID=A0AAV0XHP5_9HEMI|nr:unnamed protein product [Macrosiphum euphorbiae]
MALALFSLNSGPTYTATDGSTSSLHWSRCSLSQPGSRSSSTFCRSSNVRLIGRTRKRFRLLSESTSWSSLNGCS